MLDTRVVTFILILTLSLILLTLTLNLLIHILILTLTLALSHTRILTHPSPSIFVECLGSRAHFC